MSDILSRQLPVALLLFVGRVALGVELSLNVSERGGWTFSQTRSTDAAGVEEHVIALSSAVPSVPPKFSVSFSVPQTDVRHLWTAESELFKLEPDWSIGFHAIDTQFANSLPVFALFNGAETNRLTVALSEDRRQVKSHFGLREEDSSVLCRFFFFERPEAPCTAYRVTIRVDRRRVFWSEPIREATAWLERANRTVPLSVPPVAFEPLYSTWYCFHQDVTDRAIEDECRHAAALGMKALIVDDGWQTDDTNRGYAFTGDWKVSARRFPDMAAHVARVQAMGMKYMMWFGIPFVGEKNAATYDRFRGKFLTVKEGRGFAVLDPRFPEVREHLSSLCERAARDWNLDGFKFDFIDQFRIVKGIDPAVAENYAGRDFKGVPEATECLMTNLISRLKAHKPDLLVEFRQPYVGPNIRRFGNMLRAGDCPGDALANRLRTVNLRLTSGSSCVHSDMLAWHPDESPEEAATQVLSCLFSTVQYSMMLRRLPETHLRMMRHWIGFQGRHRDTLQRAVLVPHHPEAGYPLVEARGEDEKIAAVYVSGTICPVDADRRTIAVNASGAEGLVLESAVAGRAVVYDTFGEERLSVALSSGLSRVDVPRSGFAVFTPEER